MSAEPPRTEQAFADPVTHTATALAPRELCTALFRHKVKVAIIFLATVVSALVFVVRKPHSYTSEARLLVRRGRESVSLDPTTAIGNHIEPVSRDWQNEINSELDILRSDELASQVVWLIGAERLTASGGDAGRSRGGPQFLRDLRAWLSARLTPSAGDRDATEGAQDDRHEALIMLAENLRAEVLKKSNIISVAYRSRSPALSRDVVAAVTGLYQEKHIQAHRTPGAYEFFEEQTAQLKAELQTVEEELRELMNESGVSSPGDERAAIARRLEERRGLKHDTTDSLRQEIRKLNDYEIEIHSLTRERDMLEAKYHRYSESLEQARIDQAMNRERISNIGVVQAASLPFRPDSSHKKLIMMLAVLVGAAAAIGVVVLAESLDQSLRGPDDVAQGLGLPLLSYVPLVSRREISPKWLLNGHVRKTGRRRGRRRSWGTSHDLGEHFTYLCERIAQSFNGKQARPIVIGVTSTHAGEGVSSVAAHMVLTLVGSMGAPNVLFVNANAHRSDAPHKFGLTATLSGEEVGLDADGQMTLIERNLYRAPEAAADPDSRLPVLSGGYGFAGLMRIVRQRNDPFVIFDMPAISDGTAALRLAGLMDGVVLVVEAEGVRRPAAEHAKNALLDARANILGVVLNKRRFHVPDWLYAKL